ncbi:hypothetical protein SAMN05444166_5541 [Singulisphaera sp. GP187]|uniref:hypothetical protein n=1 Tax=Singulisphaera sp. GP187 TaxID=1882752 RepID=UPI00092B23ED|nr:hypothetical protein [Singulisphaera sp. GP187]SIO57998.1 hypothetical protein SAMN05444166_5541 [Singulisphaera sp. GP187]
MNIIVNAQFYWQRTDEKAVSVGSRSEAIGRLSRPERPPREGNRPEFTRHHLLVVAEWSELTRGQIAWQPLSPAVVPKLKGYRATLDRLTCDDTRPAEWRGLVAKEPPVTDY